MTTVYVRVYVHSRRSNTLTLSSWLKDVTADKHLRLIPDSPPVRSPQWVDGTQWLSLSATVHRDRTWTLESADCAATLYSKCVPLGKREENDRKTLITASISGCRCCLWKSVVDVSLYLHWERTFSQQHAHFLSLSFGPVGLSLCRPLCSNLDWLLHYHRGLYFLNFKVNITQS